MDLQLIEAEPGAVRAGYNCPCGCTPSVAYARGAGVVDEGCCCGNHFAVGPEAATTLTPKAGFRLERQSFDAPWGERLEAGWLVGPSVHGPSGDDGHGNGSHEHGQGHGSHEHGTSAGASVTDPVCGMTVEPESARSKGLHSVHGDADYFFCGKGCKLEFDDDPDRYLDPSYVPSM